MVSHSEINKLYINFRHM